jgi:hypothetical protein
MAEPTQDGAVNPSDGTQPPADPGQAGGQQQAPAVKTYTQEEYNRAIGAVKAKVKDRLAAEHATALEQARTAAVDDWRTQNGITDEVQAELETRDQRAADLRKAQLESTARAKDLESLQVEHKSTQDQLFKVLGENAVYAECAGKCNNPRLLNLHIKDKRLVRVEKVDGVYKSVVYTEEGEPAHGSTIGDLVTSLLERDDMQALAVPTGGNGSGSRNGPEDGAGSNGKPDLLTKEGQRAALAAGFAKQGVT